MILGKLVSQSRGKISKNWNPFKEQNRQIYRRREDISEWWSGMDICSHEMIFNMKCSWNWTSSICLHLNSLMRPKISDNLPFNNMQISHMEKTSDCIIIYVEAKIWSECHFSPFASNFNRTVTKLINLPLTWLKPIKSSLK